MFGQIKQIAKGWIADALKTENELYATRIAICKRCPLYKEDSLFGAVCNSSLCLNPDTNELSTVPKTGFICGCQCVLSKKTRVKEAKCVLGKW